MATESTLRKSLLFTGTGLREGSPWLPLVFPVLWVRVLEIYESTIKPRHDCALG